MALTSAQCEFFKLFGYLYLPNLLTEDIEWMTEEHCTVFEKKEMVHDGTKRSQIVPFIDQSERLCTLLDHPKVVEVIGALLGEDFNYVGGDGNYYSGDTGWHSDGAHESWALRQVPSLSGSTYTRYGVHPRDTGKPPVWGMESAH